MSWSPWGHYPRHRRYHHEDELFLGGLMHFIISSNIPSRTQGAAMPMMNIKTVLIRSDAFFAFPSPIVSTLMPSTSSSISWRSLPVQDNPDPSLPGVMEVVIPP
jgi:hypothetical protein